MSLNPFTTFTLTGAQLVVKIVTYDRLHSTMAEIRCVRYDEGGDGTKTPPNALHCLLLWRKLPPIVKTVGGSIFKLHPDEALALCPVRRF